MLRLVVGQNPSIWDKIISRANFGSGHFKKFLVAATEASGDSVFEWFLVMGGGGNVVGCGYDARRGPQTTY